MLSPWLACASREAYLRAGDRAALDRRRDQFVRRAEVGVLLHLFAGPLDAGLGQHLGEIGQS